MPTVVDGLSRRSGSSSLRIEVWLDAVGAWRWRALSRNGKIMATSGEGYKRRTALYSALRTLRDGFRGAGMLELPGVGDR